MYSDLWRGTLALNLEGPKLISVGVMLRKVKKDDLVAGLSRIAIDVFGADAANRVIGPLWHEGRLETLAGVSGFARATEVSDTWAQIIPRRLA